MLDGCFPAPGGRLGFNGAHGEFVERLGGELRFPEPTIKIVASQPSRGSGSSRAGVAQAVMAL